MDRRRWQRLEQIFDHLVDKSPSHRSDYLDIVCEDDAELRADVERLLRANDSIEGGRSWGRSARNASREIPRRIGDYDVDRLLGKGGMGSVYVGRHARFGTVALKVLPAFLVADSTAARRFRIEADALTRLRHPALCRLYESFVTDECACIAMELVEGEELAAVIARAPLPCATALEYVRALAAAVDVAHRHDVFHRDIKPGNVIVPSNDSTPVKLIDFGIAKFADVKLTATGQAIGSPRYMSPEQWLGKPVDRRTDLWSLGVVWYEMLTGRKPFDGPTVPDIAAAVLAAAPPPLPRSSVDGRPLANCAAVIGDLLRADIGHRLDSCAALLERLEKL